MNQDRWLRIALGGGLFSLALAASAHDAGAQAKIDYLLHCSGCHGQDGMGNPARGIPQFTNQVGHFLRIPEGRAFLMQVPGLLGARLADDRAAAVTTYIVQTYAGPSLPPDFRPYNGQEAKRYRDGRPADVIGKRNALYAELLTLGYRFDQ
jgi:mono/diheme cytochrome c family protein